MLHHILNLNSRHARHIPFESAPKRVDSKLGFLEHFLERYLSHTYTGTGAIVSILNLLLPLKSYLS